MALNIGLLIVFGFGFIVIFTWTLRTVLNHALQTKQYALQEHLSEKLALFQSRFDQNQLQSLKTLQESLQNTSQNIALQLNDSMKQNALQLNTRVDSLTEQIHQRLQEISGQVEKRLSEGFEKTTATFADVVKRLALIDAAQKEITQLSTNVISLQEVLADKRSRGAFGEVQLTALIRNLMPEQHIAFQHTLSNNKRADCMLFLPEPTGNIAIDAKFPLENYQLMTDHSLPESERARAEKQFRIDIRHHIQAISTKYIIPGETSEGAVMFIPAEAVFAEIHAHYPELVAHAQAANVWLVSPTTMMAILTTARAVLKDAATRKQVHVIQEHLNHLGKDFSRFQKRMDQLAKHIEQAHLDVDSVHTSARKITSRFNKIEKVDLPEPAVTSPKMLEEEK